MRKNFADKAQAKRVANQVLSGLLADSRLVDAAATPEIESLVAAKQVLAPSYALHVAVEKHAQAVEFYLRHHRTDVPRLPLLEVSELLAKSRRTVGFISREKKRYAFKCHYYT